MADLGFNNRVSTIHSTVELNEESLGLALITSSNHINVELQEEDLWSGTQSIVETSMLKVFTEICNEDFKYNIVLSKIAMTAEIWEEPLYQEAPLATTSTLNTLVEVGLDDLQYEIKTSKIHANAEISEEPLWEGRQSMVESSKVSVLAEVYGDPLYSKFNIYVGTVKVENIYSGNDEIQNLDINK